MAQSPRGAPRTGAGQNGLFIPGKGSQLGSRKTTPKGCYLSLKGGQGLGGGGGFSASLSLSLSLLVTAALGKASGSTVHKLGMAVGVGLHLGSEVRW